MAHGLVAVKGNQDRSSRSRERMSDSSMRKGRLGLPPSLRPTWRKRSWVIELSSLVDVPHPQGARFEERAQRFLVGRSPGSLHRDTATQDPGGAVRAPPHNGKLFRAGFSVVVILIYDPTDLMIQSFVSQSFQGDIQLRTSPSV